ncbi:MAG TPA: ABATE domain-containing protein [Gemmatimonadaceae bacterium]|nr:ABATE domain-containing protein [Gemmatimonadaceae bacterium]
MSLGTHARSFDAARSFRFVGGDPSLDFHNTGDWTSAGLEHDRFTDYGRLLDWAVGAGVLAASPTARFRDLARARPAEATAAVGSAWALRLALRRLVLDLAGDAVGDPDIPARAPSLDHLNALLARAESSRRLDALAGDGAARFALVWPWEGGESWAAPLEAVLWPVAHAAATLLTSAEAAAIRVCGGRDCGWAFVDRSRNRRRRWCEMEVCGMAEKDRRRRG